MANLEYLIQRKAEDNDIWKKQQMAERENATAIQDVSIEVITSEPEQYIRYLDMQGDNPTYSAGNVAMVLGVMPTATVFGTRDRWQSLHHTIKPEEADKGVKIFARDPRTKLYVLADAYDVTQTSGGELKHTMLEADSEEMSRAFTTLLNYSKVNPVVDKGLDAPAYYDEEKKELAINPDFSDAEAFAAIAAEVALTRYQRQMPDYSWSRYELDAQSVAYILCRRFGIEARTPNIERLAERFDGMDVQERKAVLDSIQDMSKQIGRSIEKDMSEQKRTRNAVRRPTR